jgi:hypothetical protein
VGQETAQAPPAKRGAPLEIHEERMLAGAFVTIKGDSFEVAFDKDRGGIRRAVAEGRSVLLETPNLHLLPTDVGVTEEPFLWTWQSTKPIVVTREGDDVVVASAGKYRSAEGSLVYRVTPTGGLEISYDFKYLGSEVHVREMGLRFGVPVSINTLEWKRRGEWSIYPDDHIGRNIGKAPAHSGVVPLVPPQNPFSQDDSPMGTNDFRSTKRRIEHASVTDLDGYGLYIDSNGEQYLRATVETDRIAVYVNDWFGGTASTAGEWYTNYGKGHELKPNDVLRGTVRLRIMSGRASEVE